MEENKLKKLNEIIVEGGPSYVKIEFFLENWRRIYQKRNLPGDLSVVQFIDHFLNKNQK